MSRKTVESTSGRSSTATRIVSLSEDVRHLASLAQSLTASRSADDVVVEWTVYIVRTARGNLYTGITKNLLKRLQKHNTGKGSKCLRGQLPVVLVWQSPKMTHSEALSTEYKIKVMGRANKVMLVEGQLEIYKTVNNGWGFALPGKRRPIAVPIEALRVKD